MDTTYILGAGMSVKAGIPAMDEITKKIFSESYMLGPGNFLSQYCSFAYPNMHFYRDEDGCVIAGEEFNLNIEEFLTSLDAYEAFTTNTKYNPRIPFEAKYLRSLIMNMIGQIIGNLNEELEVPPYYMELILKLQKGDRIITFNWDSLLEKTLDKAGFNWCYPDLKVSNGTLEYNYDPNSITVIKLHGSADWWHSNTIKSFDSVIFFVDEKPAVVRSKRKPKGESIETFIGDQMLIKMPEAPFIIPPSHFKDFPWRGLSGALWLTAYNTIVHAKNVTVIGYSMPQTDYQSKWLLRTGILFNRNTGKEFVKKFWGCKTDEDLSFALQGANIDYHLNELYSQVLLIGSQGIKEQWDESIIPLRVVNPDTEAEIRYKKYITSKLEFIPLKAEEYFANTS